MNGQLEGRVIAVTGAATGAGAAAVAALADEGARVFAFQRSSAPGADLLGRATWLRCDLTDQAATTAAFEEIRRSAGRLDVLVHAAGLWAPGAPGQLTGDDLDHMLAVNLKSTVFANQAAFELMRDRGGRIVNFGSVEGIAGNPRSAAYAAAKAGVHAWTRSAALAWAAYGVTVNAVNPVVDTTNAQRLREHFGPDGGALLEQRMKALIPLGGAMGDPLRDLAPVLVFLSGDGARFITGQVIGVDGGMRMLGA
ncbi:SDR family NAD(P)-dependent oxidoreductase [Dactylosporangium sp. NPDC048998]|uniref:SDR family NAD(P)-dependent oxidoreductase n=1 Tax=Dactylosporangium sp. NPDC048998 TaxID=3363976 RepID=UPI003721716D